MGLAVERRDGAVARSVLTGMVTDPAVLAAVAPRWAPGVVKSRWESLIGGWCVSHFREYGSAPGPAVGRYFEKWAEATPDAETVALVEGFLAHLADQAARTPTQPEHLIDLAGDLFNGNLLTQHAEDVRNLVLAGKVKEAAARQAAFRPVQLGAGAWHDLADVDDILEGFTDPDADVLIRLKDAAGTFFGSTLERDGFVALMGRAKIGKSFFLRQLAFAALKQGRRVAYFEIGDHTLGQLKNKFRVYVTRRPRKAGTVRWPTAIEPMGNRHGLPAVVYDERVFPQNMTEDEVKAAWARMGRAVGRNAFRYSVHPNWSISVTGIEAVLDAWARDEFYPDVVLIDYADILAPIDPGIKDERDRINQSWMAMRRMCETRHCLVLTLTQSDANSYRANLLRLSNFTNDRRKYDHVTAMFGINQTDDEKEVQVYRLNCLLARDLEFSEETVLWTAACLGVGNPMVLTTF